MPPKGWKKEKDGEVTSDAPNTWLEAPRWNKNFVPFGDRVDFLSPESQHLATGKLKVLPPRDPKKRDKE